MYGCYMHVHVNVYAHMHAYVHVHVNVYAHVHAYVHVVCTRGCLYYTVHVRIYPWAIITVLWGMPPSLGAIFPCCTCTCMSSMRLSIFTLSALYLITCYVAYNHPLSLSLFLSLSPSPSLLLQEEDRLHSLLDDLRASGGSATVNQHDDLKRWPIAKKFLQLARELSTAKERVEEKEEEVEELKSERNNTRVSPNSLSWQHTLYHRLGLLSAPFLYMYI